jgi:hypothetical protein
VKKKAGQGKKRKDMIRKKNDQPASEFQPGRPGKPIRHEKPNGMEENSRKNASGPAPE